MRCVCHLHVYNLKIKIIKKKWKDSLVVNYESWLFNMKGPILVISIFYEKENHKGKISILKICHSFRPLK